MLSTISVVVGAALVLGGIVGGNVAAALNLVVGVLPPDNPYYRMRHGLDPETGAVVDEEKAARLAITAEPETDRDG